MTAQAATDAAGVARAVLGATRAWPIPVLAALVGGARVAPGVRALEDGGVPCYPFPEPAVTVLAGMAILAERRLELAKPVEPPPRAPLDPSRHLARLRAAGSAQLGLVDLAPLLTDYGIPVAVGEVVATPAEAAEATERISFPVALKLVSPDISHKTEVGGVRLGLRTAAEVREAGEAMLTRARAARPAARIRGLLVQPMVPPGKELLLGVVRDAQFGPLVMVGFGGVYVEVLRDTAARLAPLSPAEADRMLDELRMAPLLRGVRGEPPVDRAALAEAISRVGQLAADLPDLVELELNPLVAGPGGVVGVDARATLAPPIPESDPGATSSRSASSQDGPRP